MLLPQLEKTQMSMQNPGALLKYTKKLLKEIFQSARFTLSDQNVYQARPSISRVSAEQELNRRYQVYSGYPP
jgi:hypothetical protein